MSRETSRGIVPVAVLCALFGISRPGYYAALKAIAAAAKGAASVVVPLTRRIPERFAAVDVVLAAIKAMVAEHQARAAGVTGGGSFGLLTMELLAAAPEIQAWCDARVASSAQEPTAAGGVRRPDLTAPGDGTAVMAAQRAVRSSASWASTSGPRSARKVRRPATNSSLRASL